MTTQQAPPTGLEREMASAIDELQAAFEQGSAATDRLRGVLPRIAASAALLDQLEDVVRSVREQLGSPSRPAGGTALSPFPSQRPGAAESTFPPPSAPGPSEPAERPAAPPASESEAAPRDESAPAFRLQFHSHPGPLDLRAVDEAVSEHPAVRDVALLDYDGHTATLKVWVESGSDLAAVQDAIAARAREMFAAVEDFSVVPLDQAA